MNSNEKEERKMISDENPPFGYLVNEVGKVLMNVMEPVLSKQQLTVAHWQVLNSIPFSDETRKDEIIRLFADRGWLDPNNIYKEGTNELKLTKEGVAAQAEIFNEIHASRVRLFKNISNEDFQIARQVMEQIVKNNQELHI